jgi:hypothetical protein
VPANAGVGDQDAHPAELTAGRVGDRAHAVGIAHVAAAGHRLPAAAGDLRGDLLGGVAVAPVADRDPGPGAGEGERDGAADAPRAARDERRAALEVSIAHGAEASPDSRAGR